MTPEKVKEALVECSERLRNSGYSPIRSNMELRSPMAKEQLQHARWMAEHAQLFLKDERLEKAMRWLGFIQGVMWTNGLGTIAELKDMNKPPEQLPG